MSLQQANIFIKKHPLLSGPFKQNYLFRLSKCRKQFKTLEEAVSKLNDTNIKAGGITLIYVKI